MRKKSIMGEKKIVAFQQKERLAHTQGGGGHFVFGNALQRVEERETE
jgi:hypothetical protein